MNIQFQSISTHFITKFINLHLKSDEVPRKREDKITFIEVNNLRQQFEKSYILSLYEEDKLQKTWKDSWKNLSKKDDLENVYINLSKAGLNTVINKITNEPSNRNREDALTYIASKDLDRPENEIRKTIKFYLERSARDKRKITNLNDTKDHSIYEVNYEFFSDLITKNTENSLRVNERLRLNRSAIRNQGEKLIHEDNIFGITSSFALSMNEKVAYVHDKKSYIEDFNTLFNLDLEKATTSEILNEADEKIKETIRKIKRDETITNSFSVYIDISALLLVNQSNNPTFLRRNYRSIGRSFHIKTDSDKTMNDKLKLQLINLLVGTAGFKADDETLKFIEKNKHDVKHEESEGEKTYDEKVELTIIEDIIIHIKPENNRTPTKFLKTPKVFENKRHFINPENKDNQCLIWCLIVHEIYDDLTNKYLKKAVEKHKPNSIIRVYADLNNLEIPKRITDKTFQDAKDVVFNHFLKDHPYWVNYFKQESTKGIYLKHLDKICKDFNKNIKVYTLTEEEDAVYQIYKFDYKKQADISLYMITDEKTVNRSHFMYIKNIHSMFTTLGKNKDRDSSDLHLCDVCMNIIKVNNRNDTETVNNHLKYSCIANPTQRIVMPQKNTKVRFTKNYTKIFKDFAIYWDLESAQVDSKSVINKEIKSGIDNIPLTASVYLNCFTDPKLSKGPYYIKNEDPKKLMEELFGLFLELHEYSKKQYKYPTFDKNKLTREEKILALDHKIKKKPIPCHYCNEEIQSDSVNNYLTIDHCHLTGDIRGFAHLKCNSSDKIKKDIDVFAHNSMRYDFKLLLKYMSFKNVEIEKYKTTRDVITELNKNKTNKYKRDCEEIKKSINEARKDNLTEFQGVKLTYKSKDINCIHKGGNNFLRFKIGNLIFRDSMSLFSSSSLERLVDEVYDKGKNYDGLKATRTFIESEYPHLKPEEVEYLASTKGIYPYPYLKNIDSLKQTKMPTFEDFQSKIKRVPIEDFNKFKKDWELLKVKDFDEYTKFYNCLDTVQVADVINNLRKLFHRNYQIDVLYYITIPSACWDGMLKHSQVGLDLLHDQDMYRMVRTGLRGGNTRVYYNKYEKNQNPNTESIPIDVNNMYGKTMSEYLPTKDFEFISNLTIQDILNTPLDSNKGYILEIDIEVKEKYHNYLSNYPLFFKKESADYSPIMKLNKLRYTNKLEKLKKEEIEEYLRKSQFDKHEKLIQTLAPQKNYVLHYHMLKSICSIKYKDDYVIDINKIKIHRILEFTQESFMKSYIDLNTSLRNEAKSRGSSQESLFKLWNNSVFGKSMQNIEKYSNYKFCLSKDEYLKHVTDVFYKNHQKINDDMVIVNKFKRSTIANQPVIVGMSILDKSKTILIDYWYQIIKPNFKERARIQYTDTDSFYILIDKNPKYKSFWHELEALDLLKEFDISGLHKDYYKDLLERNQDILNENKGKIGLFSPDAPLPLQSMTCLAAKMYTYSLSDYDKEKDEIITSTKIKNVGKGVYGEQLRQLTKKDYQNALKGERKYVKQYNMEYRSTSVINKKSEITQTNNRGIIWIEKSKIALNNMDNKGYVQLKENELILPWGHKDIKKIEENEINQILEQINN